MPEKGSRKKLALYASPDCRKGQNLWLYKGYFNVAWFVRAYSELLFRDYEVVTTDETRSAVLEVEQDKVDEELADIWPLRDDFRREWQVPFQLPQDKLVSIGGGFDAQVCLAAMVAKGEVDRLLMFQDPDDVQVHLSEAYALVRNCTLANIPLNINAGATLWAEAEWQRKNLSASPASGFGTWRGEETRQFHEQLNPTQQTVAFVAHDNQKTKMSRLIYHFRRELNAAGFELTGTSGTCQKAREYLADKDTPPWEEPSLRAAGAAGSGHGPTGGDVVIADEIIARWKCDETKKALVRDDQRLYKAKPPVRKLPLSHTVIFFIDHEHAQPHQADIHVLLRTCLHPSHGVHLLLNERTAHEWGHTLRDRSLSSGPKGGNQ